MCGWSCLALRAHFSPKTSFWRRASEEVRSLFAGGSLTREVHRYKIQYLLDCLAGRRGKKGVSNGRGLQFIIREELMESGRALGRGRLLAEERGGGEARIPSSRGRLQLPLINAQRKRRGWGGGVAEWRSGGGEKWRGAGACNYLAIDWSLILLLSFLFGSS